MNLGALSQTPLVGDLSTPEVNAPEVGGDHAAAGAQFEKLLATMLVKEMRKTLSDGFFGEGPGADSFGGWLDESIGDNLAGNWELDIAGLVKTNLDNKQAQLDDALKASEGLLE
ncbi:MAG: hypothetical protein ACI8X5_002044 [Planctomycetota bacterium]|jgi:hypothetical protein